MFRTGFSNGLAAWVAGLALLVPCSAGRSENFPRFEEVYQLVLTNLPGVTAGDLNRAAVEGILSNFAGKVTLSSPNQPSPKAVETNLLTKTSVLEDRFAYLRVARVENGLEEQLRKSYSDLAATNRLAGMVLDLRYATGDDYAAVAPAVGLFLKRERPVLDWGKGMISAGPAPEPIGFPVAVLVNAATTGAPEAFAGALRQTGVAIILGSKTAGHASIAKEFRLQAGQELVVMSGPIKLGDGSNLEPNGLNPDIVVEVPVGEERALYEDPFRAAGTNSIAATLSGRRGRYDEAQLVRERRDGVESNLVQRARRPEPTVVVIADPALARAADLLKGLAVIRKPQG